MSIVEKKQQQRVLTPVNLRKNLGLTQKQVAELLGIREATLSNWETGKVPHIPPSKIKRMMEVYQCDIDTLIEAFEGKSLYQ